MLKIILALVLAVVAAGLVPAPVEATTRVETTFDATHPLNAPKIVNGVEYQYDANGNLLNDGERTYQWNLENRPSTINTINSELSTTHYVYDGDGRRIIKSIKVSECQGVKDECQSTVYINQYLQLSTTNSQLSTIYYYPVPPATAIRDSDSNTVRYLHPDHLGSTRLISDSQGDALTSTINYFPYGESVKVSEYQSVKELTPYLYTGQELDPETALYNLNARLYNPTTAHFLSADPMKGGYNYGSLNPLSYRDPSGLQEKRHVYIFQTIENYAEFRAYLFDEERFTIEEREHILSLRPEMRQEESLRPLGVPVPKRGRLYVAGPESLVNPLVEELERIREEDPDLYYQIGNQYSAITPLGSNESKILSLVDKKFIVWNTGVFVADPKDLKLLPLDGRSEYTIYLSEALAGAVRPIDRGTKNLLSNLQRMIADIDLGWLTRPRYPPAPGGERRPWFWEGPIDPSLEYLGLPDE